jgi:hypothetical protein
MKATSKGWNPSQHGGSALEFAMAAGVSMMAGLLVIAPFFWLGNASGHDITFHASSWLDAAGQWQEGIVFPRWAEWANHGFGEPRFIFYPPLSWMLGAALGFVVPWNAVPMVFIVLAQTAAGVSLFALAHRFLPRSAALLGAAIYAANPYALLIIYLRSDFAELLACAFYPLVMLTAMRLAGLVEEQKGAWGRKTAIFAIAFAGVWLSNAPAGVIASYSVAMIFGWAALETKNWAPLLRGAGGLAVGFGLTGFYLVPAAYEQRWVNIGQALSSGLLPSQNFLYAIIADADHNEFNCLASNTAVILEVLLWMAVLLGRGLVLAEGSRHDRRKVWRTMVVASVVGTFLMTRGSSIFWEYLPKLRFVQFPWRWMAVLAVALAYFGAQTVVGKRAVWVSGLVGALALAGTASFLVQRAWWDSEDIPLLREGIAKDQGFDGTDEYDPAGDDHTDLPLKAERVQIFAGKGAEGIQPVAKVEIQKWTAEERIVAVTSSEPLRIGLRLLDYPAWQAEINGRTVTPQHGEMTGQIIVPTTAGQSRINLRFKRTRDREIGGVLTLLAVLGTFALYLHRTDRPAGLPSSLR